MKQWIKDANNEFLNMIKINISPIHLIKEESSFFVILTLVLVLEFLLGAIFCSVVLDINGGPSALVATVIMLVIIGSQLLYMYVLRKHWLNYGDNS